MPVSRYRTDIEATFSRARPQGASSIHHSDVYAESISRRGLASNGDVAQRMSIDDDGTIGF